LQMLNSINSVMAGTSKDEVFEITDKNYQKISETHEKYGYTEGITDGRGSVFQTSFDHGYEDGLRIGFLMGKAQVEKAGRGNCALCDDGSLLAKLEEEAR